MNKAIVLLVIISLVFSMTLPVHADTAIDKLGRGVANTITCVFEVPKAMGDVKDKDGFFAGFTVGPILGICKTVRRALVGVYEMVTFPIPLPAGYKPILTDPEYFMEDYLTGQ